jgi:phosphoribosylformylglycinamidine synthase subunit PurQ / glutaminase
MEKKIAVVQFPGSNCEDESIFALKRAGIPCEEFLWNGSVEKLKSYAGYFIVGGFSYEDRSRAGVIASLDSVMRTIAKESKSGKVVLGICNGAQILVESGLVPGYRTAHVGMVLARNKMEAAGKIVGVGYYNDYCYLKTGLSKGSNAFNRKLDENDLIRIPFAHAEGRFIFEKGLADRMESKGMLAFRYVDKNGNLVSDYPINPNGSERNVAAVVNPAGNIMAMMPHPERVEDGDRIFQSVAEYAATWDRVTFNPGEIEEPKRDTAENAIPVSKLEKDILHLPVKLIITDNTACSIEDALEHKGFDVQVERWVLWSIESSSTIDQSKRQDLISSGELLNTNKEWIDEIGQLSTTDENEICFLVDSPVNPIAAMKLQTLTKRFGMKFLKTIRYRMVWKVKSRQGALDLEKLVKTHIFHNPVTDTLSRL